YSTHFRSIVLAAAAQEGAGEAPGHAVAGVAERGGEAVLRAADFTRRHVLARARKRDQVVLELVGIGHAGVDPARRVQDREVEALGQGDVDTFSLQLARVHTARVDELDGARAACTKLRGVTGDALTVIVITVGVAVLQDRGPRNGHDRVIDVDVVVIDAQHGVAEEVDPTRRVDGARGPRIRLFFTQVRVSAVEAADALLVRLGQEERAV